VMRPYVVRAAYDASGHEILQHTPQALRRAIAPEVAHTVNQLLRGVVHGRDGTGRLAQVADFTVAGKTGTAQMVNPATGTYDQHRMVASFVGFLPADDPRLVILVVLYDVPRGHFGGLVAAPVFSEIASGALRRLDIAPAHDSYDIASMFGGSDLSIGFGGNLPGAQTIPGAQKHEPRPVKAISVKVRRQTPDFRGLSLRGALALAREHGLDLDVKGSGYVRRQEPAPDAAVDRGTVQIVLSAEDGAVAADEAIFPQRSMNSARPPIHLARATRGRTVR
jgi:cell division protein FtsI (penicillin-binding protein 3)